MTAADLERNVQGLLTSATYRNQQRCLRDICRAISSYSSLKPKLEKYMFTNGVQRDLICLHGTIPVPIRGKIYNIPTDFYILDTHPLHAPLCYVRPTSDMQIKPSRHVDQNGQVFLHYLHEWTETSSDILGLIQICIITFSESCPVFTKPSGPAIPPPPPSNIYGQQPMYPPSNTGINPPPTYHPYNPVPVPSLSSTSNVNSSIDQDYLKASLISAVEDKIRRLIMEEFNTKQVEIESLRKTMEDLHLRQNKVKASVSTLQSEIINLDCMKLSLNEKKQELEQLKSSLEDGNDADIDEVIQVKYPLYNQLFNSFAEDAAFDDSIYYLGEGLRRGVIDCDIFLKNARNISRKQFFSRLTAIKCRTKANLNP